MNLLQAIKLATGELDPMHKTYLVREERIKREGSPYYTWNPGAVAAGATSTINVSEQFPDSRKYQPLDWIEVVNAEASNDATLNINGRDSFKVPAGAIRTVKRGGLWQVAITNDGGAAFTAGNVIVTLRKEPLTVDKWARKQ